MTRRISPMRRLIFIAVALCVAASVAPAQDAQKVLETFRRNFAIASLDVKIQILQDAAANTSAAELGPLFQQALEFVLENVSLITKDPRFRQLAEIAAEQVAAIGYAPARTALWRLFQDDTDTGIRDPDGERPGGGRHGRPRGHRSPEPVSRRAERAVRRGQGCRPAGGARDPARAGTSRRSVVVPRRLHRHGGRLLRGDDPDRPREPRGPPRRPAACRSRTS